MSQDACTLWPDGWWRACCVAHDLAYETGASRLDADVELLSCVATSAEGLLGLASVGVAALMFVGVRVFGGRFWRRAQSGTHSARQDE